MQQLQPWIARNPNPSWIPIVSLQLGPQTTFFFFFFEINSFYRGGKKELIDSPSQSKQLTVHHFFRREWAESQTFTATVPSTKPSSPRMHMHIHKYRAYYCTVNRDLQPQHFLITDSQTMAQKSFQQQCQVENRAPQSVHAKTLLWSRGTSSSTPASASSVQPGRTSTKQRPPAAWPHSSTSGGSQPVSEPPPPAQDRQPSPERARKGAALAGRA